MLGRRRRKISIPLRGLFFGLEDIVGGTVVFFAESSLCGRWFKEWVRARRRGDERVILDVFSKKLL